MKNVLKNVLSAIIVMAILLGSLAGCKKEEAEPTNSEMITEAPVSSADEEPVTEEKTTSAQNKTKKSEKTAASSKSSATKSKKTTQAAKSTKATSSNGKKTGKQAPDIRKNEVKYVKNSSGKVTGLEIKIWGTYSKFNSISKIYDEETDYSVYVTIDGGIITDENWYYSCYLKNGNILIDYYRWVVVEERGNSSIEEPDIYQSGIVVDSCSYSMTNDYALIKIKLNTPVSLDDYSIDFTVGKGVFETADGKLNEEFNFPD